MPANQRRVFACLTLLFVAFIVWVIYRVNTGQHFWLIDLVAWLPYGDKFGHALLFGTLCLLVNFGSGLRTYRLFGMSVFHGSTIVLIGVTLEELSQHFIATRTLNLFDYLADLVGIGVATYVSHLWRGKKGN